MLRFMLPALLLGAGLMTGCQPQQPVAVDAKAASAPAIDQAHPCEVSDFRVDVVAGVCKPGQKVAFLPRSFGNEQLPILFAALHCDLRYTVVLSTGGVTCIYQPVTRPPEPAESAQPDQPTQR